MTTAARSAPRPVVIIARSARALATAARAAGWQPYVIDLFGDVDTRAASVALRVTAATADYRFVPARLCADFARLQRVMPAAARPVVWGGGLDGEAALLQWLGEQGEILGTPARRLPDIQDPRIRQRRLRALGVATPAIALQHVPTRGRWLRKTRAQAGGFHVQWARPGDALAAADYAQAFIAGRSLSVAFVASEDTVEVLGFSAHLFWPSSSAPFGYGGAVGGVVLAPRLRRSISAAVPRIARAFGLRGLAGIDFVLDAAGDWWLIEINARPTATVELLTSPAAAWRAHVAACRGEPWRPARPRRRPRAQAVVLADDPIRVANSLDWPAWVVDRPDAGARLPRGAPLCSVWADGDSTADACAQLARRIRRLRRMLGSDARTVPSLRQPSIP